MERLIDKGLLRRLLKHITESKYPLSKYNSLQEAINDIGSESTILLINRNEIISNDVTVPTNIVLKFKQGNILTISDNVTLTIESRIIAGRYKIFDIPNTGRIDSSKLENDEIYPEWLGAKGDGNTIDTRNLQLTIDNFKGHKIKLAKKIYITDYPLYVWSHTSLEGSGKDTILYNTNSAIDKGIVIKVGSFWYPWFTDETYNDNNINRVSTFVISERITSGCSLGQVTFNISSTNISKFKVGELCWIHGEAGKETQSGFLVPYFNMISRIKFVDTTNNTITIETPVYMDYPWPIKVKVLEEDPNAIEGVLSGTRPRYLAQNVTIRDMTIRTTYDNWIREGGSYQCTFERLWIEGAKDNPGGAIFGNGYNHCTFRDIVAKETRAIVFGLFSSFNTIENITINTTDCIAIDKALFYLNEYTHHNTIRNFKLNYVSPIHHSIFVIDGYENEILDSKFILKDVGRIQETEAGLIHMFKTNTSQPNGEDLGNLLQTSTFQNNEFRIDTARYHFVTAYGNCKVIMNQNLIQINSIEHRFSGDTANIFLYKTLGRARIHSRNTFLIKSSVQDPLKNHVDYGNNSRFEDEFLQDSVVVNFVNKYITNLSTEEWTSRGVKHIEGSNTPISFPWTVFSKTFKPNSLAKGFLLRLVLANTSTSWNGTYFNLEVWVDGTKEYNYQLPKQIGNTVIDFSLVENFYQGTAFLVTVSDQVSTGSKVILGIDRSNDVGVQIILRSDTTNTIRPRLIQTEIL